MNNLKKITSFQLLFLLIHAQIGVGIITLPNEIFMKAKSDSWISVLLAGLVIQLAILIYGFLMRRYPSKNLYEVMTVIFGKIIGKILVGIYILYFIFLGSVFFARFVLILKTWMMPLTPKPVLVGIIALLSIYAVRGSLQSISRFFMLASAVIFFYFVFAIYSFKDGNITYILPIGDTGVMPILAGASTAALAFQGYEYFLFLYPVVRANTNEVLKTATLANILVTIFYTIVVLANSLFFSEEEFKLVPEPLLYLIKSFTFKIIERPDLIFTTLWIVLVTTTSIMILYIASLGVVSLFESGNRTIYVLIIALLAYSISLFFNGVYDVVKVSKLLSPLVLIFSLFFPAFMSLIVVIFNKREANAEHEK